MAEADKEAGKIKNRKKPPPTHPVAHPFHAARLHFTSMFPRPPGCGNIVGRRLTQKRLPRSFQVERGKHQSQNKKPISLSYTTARRGEFHKSAHRPLALVKPKKASR
jgi:hypothetical protein